MPAKHAKLSPSGAKLDLKCPGNRREQAKFPRSRSEAADKGTGAHAVGERCLLRGDNALEYLNWWCGCNAKGADFVTEAHPGAGEVAAGVAAFTVDAKMASDVQLYVDEVRKVCGNLPGCQLGVEIRSTVNDNVWGTTDAAAIQYYGRLHIIDYKNGVTYVDAYRNPQLMLYAIGLLMEYMAKGIEFRDVVMTIAQPNTRGGAAVRDFGPVTPAELLKWRDEVYLPAADRCLDPNAPLNPGPWCKEDWCDARHSCAALMAYNNQVVQGMFSPAVIDRPVAPPAPIAMTPEQRKIVLENKDLVVDWLNKVYEFEYGQHMQGLGSWGKLVKGMNSRSWYDKDAALVILNDLLHGEVYGKPAMKSPAQVENSLKALGYDSKQVKAAITGLVKVSSGKQRLVAIDKPGAVVSPVAEMFTNH
jgi:hypothetical protein